MNAAAPLAPSRQTAFWTRWALVKIALATADPDDFEDCCRTLIAERVSLRENIDVLDGVIDELRAERALQTNRGIWA